MVNIYFEEKNLFRTKKIKYWIKIPNGQNRIIHESYNLFFLIIHKSIDTNNKLNCEV